MIVSPALRSDRSIISQWWWSVDRVTLLILSLLIAIGTVIVGFASGAVADRIGLPPDHFILRHIFFATAAAGIMIGVSMLGRKMIWRVASLLLVTSFVFMVAAILAGPEVKGATRWISLFGFSLQPSEFAKPAFAVTAAWLMARHQYEENFKGQQIAFALFVVLAGLLLLQPDLGMAFVVSAIWGTQLFLSGLPFVFIFAMAGLLLGGLVLAYLFFPHVTSRMDRFFDPASGDNYQVQKSLDAFNNGGLFGTGPAHGQVKMTLPDAHADFIFAVAGEEFGMVMALLLIVLFAAVLLRGAERIFKSEDLFVILGAAGLLAQFALQGLVHMGSSVQLLPAKGMTLPFISYGGSSLLALGFGMGMLLSLTRKRVQTTAANWSFRGAKEDLFGF